MKSQYLKGEDPRQLLEKRMRDEGRLPPGQSATIKWPVLHEGAVPRFDRATWDFKAGGLVETPVTLTWEQMKVLLPIGLAYQGVLLLGLLQPATAVRIRAVPRPEVRYVMAVGHVGENRYGYSTNIPLADLDRENVLLAMRRNGADLDPEHGGPLRLLVPHLYAWKSCKWIRGLIFMDEDKAGYWEERGYHMRGDPFGEERFS